MTTRQVLIVDDEPKMQRILEIMLTQMGHNALLASNGQEALEIIKVNCVDLVVSDLQMPVMTGMELLKTCANKASTYPVLSSPPTVRCKPPWRP